eukprot:12623116-Alexandrium_andersonii.AAC.1
MPWRGPRRLRRGRGSASHRCTVSCGTFAAASTMVSHQLGQRAQERRDHAAECGNLGSHGGG